MPLTKTAPYYPAAQWAVFPLLMFGPPIVAWQLMQAGISMSAAMYSVLAVMVVLFFMAERVMPYKPEWNVADGDVRTDVISGVIAYGILPVLIKPLIYTGLAVGTAWLAAQYGADVWPTDWHIAAQVVLLLLVADAGRYWGHRLAHEVPWLWRFHANHHSPNRLWFFNAIRQHPVDKALFTVTELLFPVLLGVNGEVLALYFLMTASNGFFQHCNIDAKLGPLYYVFNAVHLHRWHHSKLADESNHNYGNNIIVYDLLFGTFYLPKDREVGPIGVLNPDYPKGYVGQFLAPFRRGKLDKAQPAQHERVSSD